MTEAVNINPTMVDERNALVEALHRAIGQVNQIVVGKKEIVNQAFTCLLGDGHLLLEDLPGVGKTTLAHALALSTGMRFKRVQFTSDMLPADILGISIYSRQSEQFQFHPGPIFSQLMVADEINRATPKAQSALLEAMAERQVTVDGQTHPLPEPFFVIATQNPVDLAGTFPLPDSQLDRFLMKLAVGYPDPAAERQLLEQPDRQSMLNNAEPLLAPGQLISLQKIAESVHAAPALLDYLQALVTTSREFSGIVSGISPRGALAVLRAARASALLQDRDHLIPEDVQRVFLPVAAHRLRSEPGNESSLSELAQAILEQVPTT